MTPERINSEKIQKGVSIEECIKKADKYIKNNGSCLFLFDVKGSRIHPNRQQLQEQLIDLMANLNSEFEQYLPENNLMISPRFEKGFSSILGDASWAGINNSEVIVKIVDFIHQKMPTVEFHFDVAQHGFDSPNLKIIK
ncbi:MAG: hypothetical protein PHX84_00805 [Candidatus Shapirobacteria bacterium]|nr:hypothetical protein [Candidatus Shapirobacteria bacterium]